MSINDMADEYLVTIDILSNKIENLRLDASKENVLEARRKIFEKIADYESALNQNVQTYHYIINYYNKDSKIKQWI